MKTPGSDINSIVLIIIDQLRADYGRFLPKCSKLLQYSAICETGSIPASTEAMHANISTGKFPREHGFISKNTGTGTDGLEQIIGRFTSSNLQSLASLGNSYGYFGCFFGFKAETVAVMGLPGECGVTVHYSKAKKGLVVNGRESHLVNSVNTEMTKLEQPGMSIEGYDRVLLSLLNVSLSEIGRKSLCVTMLPALDTLGHRFGPGSNEVAQHLLRLDKLIGDLVQGHVDGSAWIVTGDHGCRRTAEYVLEWDDDDAGNVAVYRFDGDKYELQETFLLGRPSGFSSVQHDGGVLRIWLADGVKSLSEEDYNFLSRYGTVCSNHGCSHDDKTLLTYYNNSNHPNIGDITVVSNDDVTFCKGSWVRESVLVGKVRKLAGLEVPDLPLGEHGTHHQADREVLFISNRDFGLARIYNVQIRTLMECLMRGDYK
jgi:hypothetical protein